MSCWWRDCHGRSRVVSDAGGRSRACRPAAASLQRAQPERTALDVSLASCRWCSTVSRLRPSSRRSRTGSWPSRSVGHCTARARRPCPRPTRARMEEEERSGMSCRPRGPARHRCTRLIRVLRIRVVHIGHGSYELYRASPSYICRGLPTFPSRRLQEPDPIFVAIQEIHLRVEIAAKVGRVLPVVSSLDDLAGVFPDQTGADPLRSPPGRRRSPPGGTPHEAIIRALVGSAASAAQARPRCDPPRRVCTRNPAALGHRIRRQRAQGTPQDDPDETLLPRSIHSAPTPRDPLPFRRGDRALGVRRFFQRQWSRELREDETAAGERADAAASGVTVVYTSPPGRPEGFACRPQNLNRRLNCTVRPGSGSPRTASSSCPSGSSRQSPRRAARRSSRWPSRPES